MALIDTGLLVRYYVDEAASGATPTEVLDAGGGTPINLTIDYHVDKLVYVETSGNRGLSSLSTADYQSCSGAINNSADKVRDALHGSKTFTLELVIDPHSWQSTANSSKVFGIGDSTVDVIAGIKIGGPDYIDLFQVYFNGGLKDTWVVTMTRHVVHVVVDSAQALAADRVKVYVDGSAVTSTVQNDITQNATLSLANGSGVFMFNNVPGDWGSFSFDGIIYYAAIYSGTFSAQNCADNYTVLAADDDTPAAGTNVVRMVI